MVPCRRTCVPPAATSLPIVAEPFPPSVRGKRFLWLQGLEDHAYPQVAWLLPSSIGWTSIAAGKEQRVATGIGGTARHAAVPASGTIGMPNRA